MTTGFAPIGEHAHLDIAYGYWRRWAYCPSDARAAYRLAEIAAAEVSGHQLNEEVTVNV